MKKQHIGICEKHLPQTRAGAREIPLYLAFRRPCLCASFRLQELLLCNAQP